MRVLLTGASGSVGRFILARLIGEGHGVTVLGRRPVGGFAAAFHPFDLSAPEPQLAEADALVHCALLHEPGRFRGGEGDDPETFRRVNVDGTQRLFESAKKAGCRRAVFLSSRAVYGDHRRGEMLQETDDPQPESLYGEVKMAGEQVLAELSDRVFRGSVLRATGVYGLPPGLQEHKWSSLFEDFARGDKITPRRATEVHGEDLAAAVSLLFTRDEPEPFEVFNVSDLLLDRRDLLAAYSEISGVTGKLPEEAVNMPGIMTTEKLRALGWTPEGMDRLRAFLRELTA
ncbi:NAD-dependent epimerase/dehydratase family protein [Roseibium sediminicola]|uniref:NAD(P)-dependent oxidoreductase n=1 Tax=Roseibium sediminicola TaxID=2933272 RepID=A0ABT0GTM7_9HYPH|nr:NAD(P)-dependent oxidoreductase [Roseibium sp. CAU 1639]MCK7612190.1 NAD(P)-dependent oxidoreductase [Roseibium sp. CAU 1639]